MSCPILKVDTQYPAPRHVARAVQALAAGGIIAYPTDTAYGLGASLENPKAIEKLYRLKEMDRGKLLTIMCADLSGIAKYAQVSDFGYRTMRRFVPGPFTFVLLATKEIPRRMLTKRRTIGIRVPESNLLKELIAGLGCPVVNTTASPYDDDALDDPIEIEQRFGHGLDALLDAGILPYERSTVVSLVDDTPEVIREGKGVFADFIA